MIKKPCSSNKKTRHRHFLADLRQAALTLAASFGFVSKIGVLILLTLQNHYLD